MKKEVYRVGVVGCGSISDIYISNMIQKFTNLEVAACCAKHMESAVKKAAKYGIDARDYEGILEDDTIDIVVILTPAPTHYELIRKALLAGKHVYTEKTMTIDRKDAEELVKLAEEKKLYLGAAPDTFLGSALQTVRKAIEDGIIGEVTGFQACANRDLDFLGSLFKFLCMPGGGICYDYGVYYLTALVSILGSADRVFGVVKNRSVKRVNQHPESPAYGEAFEYPNESLVHAVIRMKSGVTGTFALIGDSNLNDMAEFRIYGTKGVLKLTDPNGFGGDVLFIPNCMAGNNAQVLENVFPFSENSRGLGVSEMADAISSGRKNRASKEMAYHVLDIISQIMKSNETQKFEKVDSAFEMPDAFTDGEKLLR